MTKHGIYPPANDVCRALGDNAYLDVVWSHKRKWRAIVCGKSLGLFPTKRRAKKYAMRHVRETAA